jgi:large subunit ribosomal protein L25
MATRPVSNWSFPAMAQVSEIKASARTRAGTGAARAVRREAGVPAVIYGDGGAPQNIALPSNELVILMNRGRFLSTVIELDVDGAKTRVIPREVQVHPVNGKLVHVDFQRVSPGSSIRVSVPVRFIDEALSPGLKRGGVLNVVRHEVEVTCPSDAIPEVFEFSLDGLEIGRSIHISAVALPPGVKPTIQGRDFTVATIAGHRVEDEAAAGAPGAAAAEGAAPAAAEGAAAPADAKAAAGAKAPAGKDAGGAKPAAAAKGGDKGKK